MLSVTWLSACPQGSPKQKCREPYVREELLIEQFTAMLERITMTAALFEHAGEIGGMVPGLRCAGFIPSNVGR